MSDLEQHDIEHQLLVMIVDEQGQMPVAHAIMRHLSELPAETAQGIVSFIVQARGTLVTGEDDDESRRLQKLFLEGILCGLRIKTAIATLRADTG